MESFSETLVMAMFYMFFVAFSGGMGILTVVWFGYKMYNRGKNKSMQIKSKVRGAARHV